MRALLCISLVAAMILFAGCSNFSGVTGDHIEKSDGFIYPGLESGGVGVVGVTTIVGGRMWQQDHHDAMTIALEEQLMTARPDLEVVTASELRTRVGANGINNILDFYQENRAITAGAITALGKILRPQPRFLVFARIELYGLETDTHLKTIVGFDVYDLAGGEVAWHGDLTTSRNVTHSANYASDSDVGVTYGDERTYFWDMLEEIFDRFAENLPKDDD